MFGRRLKKTAPAVSAGPEFKQGVQGGCWSAYSEAASMSR